MISASLGEMVRELAGKGVKVPDGFAITAEAFRHFIREAGIDERIRATLSDLNTHDMANLSERGQHAPMDLEWAKDGITGELFIVQARPETVQPRKNLDVLEASVLSKRSKVLTSGRSVGAKIATGRVRVIKSAEFIGQFQEGEVLVTDRPRPAHSTCSANCHAPFPCVTFTSTLLRPPWRRTGMRSALEP